MKYLLIVIALLGLSGCQSLGESRMEVDAKIEKAAESRENLWVNLQIDKAMFSDDEWLAIEGTYGQAVELAAEIEVVLSNEVWPETETVGEWLTVGGIIYGELENVLGKRVRSLSPRTRAAWAVEKARLKALSRSGKAYIENPNTGTYQTLVNVGMTILGAAL